MRPFGLRGKTTQQPRIYLWSVRPRVDLAGGRCKDFDLQAGLKGPRAASSGFERLAAGFAACSFIGVSFLVLLLKKSRRVSTWFTWWCKIIYQGHPSEFRLKGHLCLQIKASSGKKRRRWPWFLIPTCTLGISEISGLQKLLCERSIAPKPLKSLGNEQ